MHACLCVRAIVDNVKNGNIKYWLDENGVLHVPKRDLKDIVRWNK